MKTLRLAATFALLCSPLALAAADDKAAAKGDLAKLQGKWTTQIGPEKEINLTVTFADHKVTASGARPQGDKFEVRGEVRLDENAKPRKTIDWVKFVDPDGNTIADNLGIYEFTDADTVRICNGGPGKDRPTEFKAGEDAAPSLIVLKRDKD